MGINFDQLPKDKPEGSNMTLPEEGVHKCTIEDASVKAGEKGDYIEVVLKLDKGGKVWDRLFTTDSPAVQYKLSRFIRACHIPLVGEMELSDLCQVVKGKRVACEIEHKENTWQGKTTTRAEVAMFAGDIYYTIEDIEESDVFLSPGETAPTPTTGSY